MSIFSLADKPAAPSFEAMIAQCTQLRLAEQQAMIADVEALLGKLAADFTCSPQQHTVPPIAEPAKFTISFGSTPVGHFEVAAAVEAPAPKSRRGRKPKATAEAPKLNAIGKPYSPQYDPNYRMKHKPRKYAPANPPYAGPFVVC